MQHLTHVTTKHRKHSDEYFLLFEHPKYSMLNDLTYGVLTMVTLQYFNTTTQAFLLFKFQLPHINQ